MTRRDWIAASGLAIASACGRPKGAGYAGYALVATSGDNSLAVIDLSTFKLLKPIPLSGKPTAVLPAKSPGQSYVLTPENGSVHLVSAGLHISVSRKLADQLSQIRLTRDGKRLLGIAPQLPELIEADPLSLRPVKRRALEFPGIDLDVAPALYAAVSTGGHGTVELFHLETGQHWRQQMAGPVGSVRFRADGQLLLVANLQDRSLAALNVPSLELIAELPLAMAPQNLCFNSDQGQLFISGEGMDGVAIVFPYYTLQVDQTVLAGRDPGVMACSSEPAYLFVGSHSGSDLCVLDIDTRAVVSTVNMGERPTYIATTPDSQFALVLSQTAGDMAVIQIPAIERKLGSEEAIGSYRVHSSLFKEGASLFAVLPVGDNPVHAAVVPRIV